jgi:hypothetical protein
MGPPDGVRGKRLPTLSWDSIVDDAPETDESSERSEPLTPTRGTEGTPPGDSLSIDSLSIKPLKIEPLPVESMSLGPLPTEPSIIDPAITPAPPPPPTPPLQASTPRVTRENLDEPAIEEPVIEDSESSGQIVPALRVVAPTSIIPVLGTIDTGPADVSGGQDAATTTDVLPEIQEATPAPGLSAAEQAVASAEQPAAHSLPVDQSAVYQLPQVPQPDQTYVRSVVAQSPLAVATPQPVQLETRHSRRGIVLLFTLVILGGLVAAGIVFGRSYLFPEEWDATTQPFAETTEDVSGVEFIEPLVVTAEPTSQYTTRMTNQLTGDWTAAQEEWRALGLLNGTVTEDVVSDLLTGWQDAIYATDDGQVYHDAAVAGDSLDSELTLAMATASSDQQFGWSVEQENRTLDDAAFTLAEVRRQSRAIQEASEFPGEVTVRDAAPLVFLPPILSYEVLAPLTYAEFDSLGAQGGGSANPLYLLEEGGPGPIPSDARIESSAPVVVEGDQVVGSPVAMDSSFWYLVFAGYVENTTAKAASEAIVENSIVSAERSGKKCVYATFSGGDVNQTATLRATIEAWSASVPPELGSSTSVLPSGALQFVSCDPGEEFDNQSRIGTARELIGWRIAELATVEAVLEAGGGDAKLIGALDQVAAAGIGVELATLPLDISPADAADSARAAVARVLNSPTE